MSRLSDAKTCQEGLDVYGDLLARACVAMYHYDPVFFGHWADQMIEYGLLSPDEALGLLDSITPNEEEEEEEEEEE